jgi:hypothetical protein
MIHNIHLNRISFHVAAVAQILRAKIIQNKNSCWMLTDEAVSHDCESELDQDAAAMAIV